ncbi:MAG: hypothetical protein ACKV2O_01560 [Acidimicrobiales bacterium]
MRSVICDDETFARLIGDGGLYDYELGERYIVAPSPTPNHGGLNGRLIMAMALAAPELLVSGSTNLGRLGEPGQRWYVVSDLLVLAAPQRHGSALLEVMIAVEIRSPREDMAVKLSHYREVMDRTGMAVGEVWYVDGADIHVHPDAAAAPDATAFPELLAAAQQTAEAWTNLS